MPSAEIGEGWYTLYWGDWRAVYNGRRSDKLEVTVSGPGPPHSAPPLTSKLLLS